MSKQEKIDLIKKNNKNNLTNICRLFKLNNCAVYHGKYSESKYNDILLCIKERNSLINERIDEVLKNG